MKTACNGRLARVCDWPIGGQAGSAPIIQADYLDAVAAEGSPAGVRVYCRLSFSSGGDITIPIQILFPTPR